MLRRTPSDGFIIPYIQTQKWSALILVGLHFLHCGLLRIHVSSGILDVQFHA